MSGSAARRLEVVVPDGAPAAPPPRSSRNGASQNGASQNGALTRELRRDLRLIADMIGSRSRVLDIGCGDGALLAYLAREKGVDARGIELRQAGVNVCVRHGLSVIQGDADHDLSAFPDQAFDVVVLSQTLQATHRPRHVSAKGPLSDWFLLPFLHFPRDLGSDGRCLCPSDP